MPRGPNGQTVELIDFIAGWQFHRNKVDFPNSGVRKVKALVEVLDDAQLLAAVNSYGRVRTSLFFQALIIASNN